MVSRRELLLGLGLLGLVAAPLSQTFPAAAGKKLNVVATTGMVGDAVKQVAGDRADVKVLMGEGVDPHEYRQTRSDVVALGEADVIFYNGLYLEAQMDQLLLDLAKKKPVVAIGEALPKDKLLAHDEYKDKFDPHVWMDPDMWSLAVAAVRDALIKRDPEGSKTYEANAAAYTAELGKLGAYAKERLATVPKDQRVLVSAHDAFNYFGRAYGYEVLGIQGISTESEAGLKQIQDLVDVLVSKKVKSVFVESSVADRNVKALLEGAKAKGATVTIGGELFSDAMGKPGTYEGSYLGMIDHNATLITRSLGGTAPEKGRSGKLALGGS